MALSAMSDGWNPGGFQQPGTFQGGGAAPGPGGFPSAGSSGGFAGAPFDMHQPAQYDFQHVTQQPPPSSYMKRQAQSRMGDPIYGAQEARPMTSNRSAGYVNQQKEAAAFDPLQQAQPKLQKKLEQSPEEKLRELEKEIHRTVEASTVLREKGELGAALDQAKEAGKKERQLCRMREQQGLLEQLNVELTYAVCLNLAIQHQANGNDDDAYQIYTQLVKNKQYPAAGRFRVNMGNICFAQMKHPTAIKMYRMALDQIPANIQGVRFKIMRNVGHSFFQMHQFPDAIDSYENLLAQEGQFLDFMTGFNLILCYYALGDKEKMKQGFVRLLSIQEVGLEDVDDEDADLAVDSAGRGDGRDDQRVIEGDDLLREDVKKRQRDAARYILNAAQLISPVIERTVIVGYDWVVDALTKNGFPGIGSELEICKASYFLRHKEFSEAMDILRRFERKEPSLMARAATNLSSLYFLEGDLLQAEKYADVATKADRYNARALVNKGNCLFVSGQDVERAKEVYLEAIGVSADCLEAIYNLGLINASCGAYMEAIMAFEKLNSITHHNCEVLWQLGDLHEKLGNDAKAHECFSLCVSPEGRPTDPGVLARIAALFAKQDDEQQSFHYYLEAYRYWPVDLSVLTWLGIYYVKQELYEQAVPFFDRAAAIQPLEAKWLLMVASCFRRMGAYQQALDLYDRIQRQHPLDTEALRYLVSISREMQLPSEKYAVELRKRERQQEAVEAMSREREMGIPQERRFPDEFDGFAQQTQQTPEPAEETPMPQATAPKKRLNARKAADDDIDWGNDELGDDLLPDF